MLCQIAMMLLVDTMILWWSSIHVVLEELSPPPMPNCMHRRCLKQINSWTTEYVFTPNT